MKAKRIAATLTAFMLILLTLILSACKVKTVKVSFDDGVHEITEVEVEAGSAVQKPRDPAKDGHVFVGWYLDGEEYDFDTPVNEDILLEAEWEENVHTITFFYYEGKEETEEVTDGDKLDEPASAVREGFTFDAWYTDEAHTKKYNFDLAVKNDLTLYANWFNDEATYFDVTYNYNYEGAPDSRVVPVEENSKAAKPADPVRADYKFLGWFTAADGETEYDFDTAVTADVEIFAHWEQVIIEGVKNYKFEAELTDLTDFEGSGFSNEAVGRQAIQDQAKWSSTTDLAASNGYWVGYLYKQGCAITFEINSDRDISDVTLKLRLSGEIVNRVTVKSNEFKVTVNGAQINYSDIVINDVPKGTSVPPAAFKDYEIGTNISLVKGKNTIVLSVDNNVPLAGSDGAQAGGKIQSTAPLVDCIKLTTAANLTWNPWFDGLEKKYGLSTWDREYDYKGIIDNEA